MLYSVCSPGMDCITRTRSMLYEGCAVSCMALSHWRWQAASAYRSISTRAFTAWSKCLSMGCGLSNRSELNLFFHRCQPVGTNCSPGPCWLSLFRDNLETFLPVIFDIPQFSYRNQFYLR